MALFADAFGGGPKRLEPVLSALGVEADGVVFVGDTAHDRRCARAVGCRFALAGWNPRAAAVAEVDDIVLAPPHTVPKTSSGKIRRVAARDYYERGPDSVRPQAVWLQ